MKLWLKNRIITPSLITTFVNMTQCCWCCPQVSYKCIFLLLLIIAGATIIYGQQQQQEQTDNKLYNVVLGPCKLISEIQCPHTYITYHLYKLTGDQSTILEPVLDKYNTSLLDPSLDTKIILHGYSSSRNESVLQDVRRGYQQRGRYNIIFVDYEKIAEGDCYPSVSYNLLHVGQCLGHFIKHLLDSKVTRIHMIGFSLGAHLANYAAVNLRPNKVDRITGLDPAMPLFTTDNIDHKLDRTDAEFVDVLHTNAFLQGKAERCGHVDFYMNGGVTQPGCSRSSHCDHHRAPQYFAESITSETGFWGWKCPTGYLSYILGRCTNHGQQILMGEFVNRSSEGWYIVKTKPKSPFAMGKT